MTSGSAYASLGFNECVTTSGYVLHLNRAKSKYLYRLIILRWLTWSYRIALRKQYTAKKLLVWRTEDCFFKIQVRKEVLAGLRRWCQEALVLWVKKKAEYTSTLRRCKDWPLLVNFPAQWRDILYTLYIHIRSTLRDFFSSENPLIWFWYSLCQPIGIGSVYGWLA